MTSISTLSVKLHRPKLRSAQSICCRNSGDNHVSAEFSLECHWNGFWATSRLFKKSTKTLRVRMTAEAIKAVGGHAEGMLAGMVSRSKVTEHDGYASDREMISMMLHAQETLAETLAGASDVAAAHGDKLTEDLCIERGQVHEKFAWMLRSHL